MNANRRVVISFGYLRIQWRYIRAVEKRQLEYYYEQ